MSKICALFLLHTNSSINQAEDELSQAGGKDFFTIEEKSKRFLGGYFPEEVLHQSFSTVQFYKEEKVDMLSQWEQFAPNFYDGKAHINIQERTLSLLPGEGFGDFSHPTTKLMIDIMQSYVFQKTVIDIGCGSGILTLASLLMGAKEAFGIDIEPKAISHAKKNAKLNELAANFSLLYTQKSYDIALMNMTFFEQKEVLRNAKEYPLWITSGILKEQKKEYLAFTKALHWKLLEEHHQGKWCGFVFASGT